jgi:magnesium-transporting ATPase (P-type)
MASDGWWTHSTRGNSEDALVASVSAIRFGVKAVALGRSIFGHIEAYIGYQLAQLFAMVLMFLGAIVFDINDGVALLPLQVLFLNFTLEVLPLASGWAAIVELEKGWRRRRSSDEAR